jgi:hypothetical protein
LMVYAKTNENRRKIGEHGNMVIISISVDIFVSCYLGILLSFASGITKCRMHFLAWWKGLYS